MRKKVAWLLVSSMVALSLIVTSCSTATPVEEGTTQEIKGEVVQKETPKTETEETVEEEKKETEEKVPTHGWLEDSETPTTAIGDPVYGGVINIATATDWQVFDTIRYAGQSHVYGGPVYEKLAIGDWSVDRTVFNFPDDSGKTPEAFSTPLLLASWEFPDPLTIIMNVRPGVMWQDKPPVNGRAFDADDVVWNLERSNESPYIEKTYFDMIESITKIDNMTVEVKLKPPAQPFSQFGLLETDSNHFVPREAVEPESNQTEDWKKVIGTGPFLVDDFVPGSSVRYVRNPNYYRDDERHPGNQLPYVDELQVAIIPELSTRVAAFRTGKTDMIGGLQWKEVQSIQQSNPETLFRSYPANSAIIYRMRNDIPPFTDARVRNAMQMAVDLEAIRDSFYQGQAYSYSPFVTAVHGDIYTPYEDLPESVKNITTYDPEGARALLAEAGYPDGFKTNITYVPTQNPGLAEILQAYLADIGVEAEMKTYDWPTFNSIRLNKQHQGIIQHWNWNSPSPILLLNVFADPTHIFNLSVANDPEFKDLMAEISVEFDYAKRSELVQKADYMTIEKSFYITMPQGLLTNAWHPWLRGYTGECTIGNFQYFQVFARLWVDEQMKSER
ncbi:MAG TPA: ABC transporter substrate-binding protein [Dehalococcoidia bacterium]|nr:ABC transporter substrate-binding protein [Dehalococcoidia bacterium]